jgi:cytochrome P450
VPETAPGPPGDPWLGHLRGFRRDVLGLLLDGAAAHGDVVRFRLGPIVAHLVNHPTHIAQVLQSGARHYDKQTRSTAAIRAICDESLLTADGPAWESRRRAVQPAFHRQRIGQLVDVMTALIATGLESWPRGRPFDVASEMMRLTFAVVGKTVLGAEVHAGSGAMEPSIAFLLESAFSRWGRIAPLPRWLPTPEHRQFRRALAEVDAVVARIVADHRRGAAQPTLLTMLMEARDADTGAAFTDAELRNEAITMLLAGHETTATALSWTFALLAAHPAAATAVRAEVHAVLGRRRPTLGDLSKLAVTTRVIHEAMRLYPPIWAIERRAVRDDTIGGFAIPAGSSVIISPFVLHRHPQFWADPLRFDPTRFDGPKPPPAYLPFGAGPRYCIGSEFAMMEARLIVAMVTQTFGLTLVPGHVVKPHPSLTLRLREGLRMVAEPA